jgi:hypothetical protein
MARIATVLLMLACARAAEYASPEATVAAYASVFKARGDPALVGVSPPVRYAEDRLRVLLGMREKHVDLTAVRKMDQKALLTLLFKAVAGDYTTGPASLGGACHFVSDPVTGVIELYHNRSDSNTVLTVVSIVLLAVLLTVVSRGDSGKAVDADID